MKENKMAENFIPFAIPAIEQEEKDAVINVLNSGWITTGKVTLEFENEFAKKLNVPYTLAVNSATSGLILALEACKIGPGDKVLTTPYTFISTATSCLHLGAEVVYADIEKDSFNIDPEKIEEQLAKDSSIKAIIPVHIAGNICDMKKICEIAKKYEVYVIEDAAHAFPAKSVDGWAGTFGDMGVFSFYATKTITTAEGGMVVTSNPELAKRMTTMRLHGIDRNVWDRYTSKKASWQYDVVDAGFKFNLPDILSAIGIEQLKKADFFLEKRKRIVEKYNQEFSKYDFFILPPDSDGNAWHLYLLGLNLSKLKIDRDEFGNLLQESGIGISMHFIPHYKFSLWKGRTDLSEKYFPNAEEHFLRTISLPLWPGMTETMVQKVIDTVVKIGIENARIN
ncbi:MAG: DegT/DnrJ/EryC1/StrS family aminotransferase [Spirochaetaceae bacterium]|nr:DegT/DnrJ/EryC1/StrS family aminotransferase [Spirochaetaceae bacterium]